MQKPEIVKTLNSICKRFELEIIDKNKIIKQLKIDTNFEQSKRLQQVIAGIDRAEEIIKNEFLVLMS